MFDRIVNEPTLVVEFVRALILCGVVFGLPLTEEQTVAVFAAVSAGLALLNRAKVTPGA